MANPDAGGKVMQYEEVWRDLNDDDSDSVGKGDSNWILENVDQDEGGLVKGAEQKRKTFYARLGKYFLALRQIVREGGVDFVALRQDLDLGTKRWEAKYEIGDVTGLWKMDERWDEKEAEGWKVGEKVVVGDEACVVRAIE